MPDGDAFTPAQHYELEQALHEAERLSDRGFLVHVGPSDGDSRAKAEALHATMPDPTNGIVIHVDPAERALEIVTGASVKEIASNRQVALAAIAMQSAFSGSDLERGIRIGLQQLAQLSRRVQSLHTHTP